MSRPPRLQFPGALYHVTSRGNRRADIYVDARDHLHWLDTLADTAARYAFRVHGYCHMPNHFHLLVETPRANLARGMAHLNGAYSRWFNHRHGLIGHLFQARYHAIVLQKQTHLLELARYTARNPVRAKLVTDPADWPWTSYMLTQEILPPPVWLDTNFILKKFGENRTDAIKAYNQFVREGIGSANPLFGVKNQLLLGDDAFIERFQTASPEQEMGGISRVQRGTMALSLQAYENQYADRDTAIAFAYATNAYSMSEIARHFKVSRTTASRAVKIWRSRLPGTR